MANIAFEIQLVFYGLALICIAYLVMPPVYNAIAGTGYGIVVSLGGGNADIAALFNIYRDAMYWMPYIGLVLLIFGGLGTAYNRRVFVG
jgi:hypothetical protein